IINHDIGKRASPTAEVLVFFYSEASFCPASFCFLLTDRSNGVNAVLSLLLDVCFSSSFDV
ncbi:hypothetical protein, partial [Streptococcus loxodontisalivarius]|uniref:hypothetical protein n=1 Tax=Streptococcus loxodontisalivarius TaxID=1349415 RepID=UPI0019601595